MNKTTIHAAPNTPPQQNYALAIGLGLGYSYFGARYYDSEVSVWLSVDPLSDKYPSTSPYMYVRGNPIMLVDPNGMWDKDADGNWTATKGDSWWKLHKQSGMSWKETMAYAKQYNKDKGRDNWKSVREGDKVTIPGSGSSGNGSSAASGASASVPSSSSQNNNSNEHGRGHIISSANGIAAFGPVGIMGDIGGVIDSYGDSRLYFTIGWAQGLGAGGGIGYSTTNKGFRTKDMNGWSSGWMASAAFISYEQFGDFEPGAIRDHSGDNMTSKGGSVGTIGFGAYHYFSFTVTFKPPSGEQLFRMVSHWH